MDALAQTRKRSQSGAISRKAILWLAIPFVIFVLLIGWRSSLHHKYERARADWKAVTLPRLAGLSFTNQNISADLETLKGGGTSGERWVSDNVLLMTNGQYLVYAFRHGLNSGFVDHLFLAHGSNGRWLYSTYHFCNSMVGVMSDDPPGSITEFATRYSAREFDGKSDERLKKTWPMKNRE